MKQIFLMSQCQYTRLGLLAVMESAGQHAVQVISVETPEQIVSHILSDRHLPGKQRVIVVDLTCHESSVTVRALWFLWNLSVLYSERHELREIPCFLFGHKEGRNNIRYPFVWISPSQNFRQLKNTFLHILAVPSLYISSGYGLQRLSVNERRVINELLSGETVSDIAKRMEIHYSNVCYYRQKAIFKIGLRNRNDIAWIMNRTFL
ncbi:LuxR family transcriptional regulator [Escherichia sp. E4930]|uniref:LuxR C-terminal-related transcriptional regulator n=1 Tax=Escherichia sp. E4930 TaxID=2044468 RepID=UPI00107F291D|nr:LuxR C-terminal-related transcriptional regulator [Escherichia sp. E4930]TGB64113.1 LuxR family transcriptional regulator [Escherichia sp. E4930]TLU78130.1 LuxR family transcriptional regulator [Escherichia sp. E4930]